MNRATPPVRIPGLQRANVTSGESAPADSDTPFTDFFTSGMDTRGGILKPADQKNALVPLWKYYERGRFRFRVTVNSGTLTDADVTIWGRTPEGENMVIGTVNLGADLQFQPLEFDIEQGTTYAARIPNISGTSPNITVDVFAQAFFVED